MSRILSTLVSLSLGGAIAIILLALWTHFSCTQYAAKWRCVIWTVLCLRLVVLFSPMMAKQAHPVQITMPPNAVIGVSPQQKESLPNESGNQPETQRPVPPQTQAYPEKPMQPDQSPVIADAETKTTSFTLFQAVFLVWIFGVMCMLGKALFAHLRFLRFLRRWSYSVCDAEMLDIYHNLCQTVRIVHGPRPRICAGIKAPMLAGFFRPVLLLPEQKLESETLRYVMLHEIVHFKRKDIWLKTLALVANCLHWFNPMMWLLTYLVERDTELACDEMVLTYLSAQEYKMYGKTILDAVEQLHTTQRTNDKRRKRA